MGSSSQNTQQSQQSSTSPWAASSGTTNGLFGALNPLIANSGLTPGESSALGGISNAANQPNPYAPAISANASSLLAGGGAMNQAGAVNQNYLDYQKATQPLASNTNYDPMSTPGIGAQLQGLTDNITQNVNGSFAAAGRDGSGYNQKALGQGLTAGLAPVLTNQYNQNVHNQQGAAGNLYNAGNTNAGILSGMQQQANANGQIGTQAAKDAWDAQIQPYQQQLQAAQMAQGIPAQNLGMLAQIGIPLAGLGRNSTGSGTSNSTYNPSILSDIGQGVGIASGLFGGGGAGGAGALKGMASFFSDRRLKEDVTRVGALFDGTPVYRYRYIGSPAFQIGLMSHEVCPEAVTEVNGYDAVNYKIATEKAAHALDWGC